MPKGNASRCTTRRSAASRAPASATPTTSSRTSGSSVHDPGHAPVDVPRPMISLDPASAAERPVLENLFQLYAYDWSELGWLDVGRDGRFAAPSLDEYWQEGHHHPFLIRVDGRPAGFVLIAARSRLTGAADVFDMAEF